MNSDLQWISYHGINSFSKEGNKIVFSFLEYSEVVTSTCIVISIEFDANNNVTADWAPDVQKDRWTLNDLLYIRPILSFGSGGVVCR